jgi:hypothetical protein
MRKANEVPLLLCVVDVQHIVEVRQAGSKSTQKGKKSRTSWLAKEGNPRHIFLFIYCNVL